MDQFQERSVGTTNSFFSFSRDAHNNRCGSVYIASNKNKNVM